MLNSNVPNDRSTSLIAIFTPALLLTIILLVDVYQSRFKSPFAPITTSSIEIDSVSEEMTASNKRLSACN